MSHRIKKKPFFDTGLGLPLNASGQSSRLAPVDEFRSVLVLVGLVIALNVHAFVVKPADGVHLVPLGDIERIFPNLVRPDFLACGFDLLRTLVGEPNLEGGGLIGRGERNDNRVAPVRMRLPKPEERRID